jgi:hypothetical protein
MDENNIGYLWDGMIYKDKESNLYFMDSKTWRSTVTDFSNLICVPLYSYWEEQDGIIELIWKANYDSIIPDYDFSMRNSSVCITEENNNIFTFYSTEGALEGSWSIWITGSFIKSYDSNWIFLQKYNTSRLSFKISLKSPAYISNSKILYAEGFNRYSSESLIK